MNTADYLTRLGLEPTVGDPPTRDALARLQRAHVQSVPFENLSITGDPFGDRPGNGVSLDEAHLYEKIVGRNRGGFCFELNGLFCWLLAELGYDVDRYAARIANDDGTFGPPADHLTLGVALDHPYIVDVGLGIPKLRQPLPADGTTIADAAGFEWRLVESDRPDADFLSQYRKPGQEAWQDRFIFETIPRTMGYFEATCEHFQKAPDSLFNQSPFVMLATENGHARLTPDTSSVSVKDDVTERTIDPTEWETLLEREFGIDTDGVTAW
ncbi:arylamine N-acetyltransferase [Haladaptatus sp. GCM10025707]|uniref:arylamine N-acetyltransferase family protein n=1 Tax=unclassified Haladaptatus TaxID=2622732 RepID=UPI0023E7E8B8|nr:arylamine N-acetyltransferase [Haladaptatus sp. QDMS2]